jgi:quercetin dioxygenase-like cupin family protein
VIKEPANIACYLAAVCRGFPGLAGQQVRDRPRAAGGWRMDGEMSDMTTRTFGSAAFVRAQDVPVEDLGDGVTRQILGYDTALMLVRVGFRQGAKGYLHHHPHRQVTYVEKGSFDVTIDGQTTVLKAGDCCFIAPDLPHGVTALEDSSLIDVFTPAREDFLK